MNAPHARDEGLRRVSRLTGWLAAGAIVGVGAIAGLLARPQSSSAGATTSPAGGAVANQVTPSVGQTSSPTIAPPTQAPVQTRRRGPAVSGGS